MLLTGNYQKINIKNNSPAAFSENPDKIPGSITKGYPYNNKIVANFSYFNALKSYTLAFTGSKREPGEEVDIESQFSAISSQLRQKGIEDDTRESLVEELKDLQFRYSVEKRVKQVKGKKSQGKGLFSEGYVDFKKIGWEHLSKEPLDWETATPAEVLAFRHAAAIAETYENPWVKKYNYINVSMPLATYHSLDKRAAKEKYNEALGEIQDKLDKKAETLAGKDVLKDLSEHQASSVRKKALEKIKKANAKFLDMPVVDSEGNFVLDVTVFDTETTGLNIKHENHNYKPDKPAAKILQIGAVKIKNGKVASELNQLVNPKTPIDEGASKVHGIYEDDVKDQPTMREVLSGNFPENSRISRENKEQLKGGFLNYLGEGPIVAYNANFDISILNSEVRMENEKMENEKEEGQPFDEINYSQVIDPFIIVQRIHPFVGAGKKLTNQYRMFFARDLEGAHDALVDVKATADMLKYCCLYLDKHYNPEEGKEKKPLTVRDVLRFQFGDDSIEGLDIKLHQNYGYDKTKRFSKSYRICPIGVKNFPGSHKFNPSPNAAGPQNKKIRAILSKEIGEENLDIIAGTCAKRKDGKLTYRKIEYKNEDNLRLYLFGTEEKGLDGKPDKGVPLKPYNGMSPEELKERVIHVIKTTVDAQYIPMWMKEIRPEEETAGNDLPDVEIIKEVMKSKKESETKAS